MIGILGGTFDPIHCGHLYIAQALHQLLQCEEIRFIPCKSPLLGKKAIATAQQRLTMLKRALKPYPHFTIDAREMERATPSYTIDTLLSLRHAHPNTPLALIVGSDTLAHLNQWQAWTALIQTAHLVVVPRNFTNITYNDIIQDLINKHQTLDPVLLGLQPAGLLFMADVKPLAISSTAIRTGIAQGSIPSGLLPSSVLDYIQEQKLYL